MKFYLMGIVFLGLLFLFGCSTKKSNVCNCKAQVVEKVIYKDRIKFKCDVPEVPEKPTLTKVNLYKVKMEDKIYYCYDEESSINASKNILLLKDYGNMCNKILKAVKSMETKDE